MKYFIYCRKSSEEEERQALSIEAQLQELRVYALENGLSVVDEYVESKSAKNPNNRPIFDQMLMEIESGRADGVLSWAPDRISRNAVDGGRVIHLIDQGIIKDLKFPHFYFEQGPQGLFNLSLAFNIGKLYVDNLSQNVQRGIREKVRRGEFPGKAPLGYFNHPKTRTIEPEEETFDKVKDLLEDFASGDYTITALRDKAYQRGFENKHGKPLNYTRIKKILVDPFYYGMFQLKGELHQGSHKPMITKDVYDEIQSVLKKNYKHFDFSKKRNKEKKFLFQGLAKCGECGFAITQEFHKKKSGRVFKYYRCTRKSKTYDCSQSLYLKEEDLAEQVKNLTSYVSINDEWYKKYKDKVEEWRLDELNLSQESVTGLKQELKDLESMIGRLLDLRLEGEISLEEFKLKKNNLLNKKSDLEIQIKKISVNGSRWFEPMMDFIKTANQAHHGVKENNFILMRKILKKTGLNPIILNRKLYMEFFDPFNLLKKVYMNTESYSSHGETFLNNARGLLQKRGSRRSSRGSAHSGDKVRLTESVSPVTEIATGVFADEHTQRQNTETLSSAQSEDKVWLTLSATAVTEIATGVFADGLTQRQSTETLSSAQTEDEVRLALPASAVTEVSTDRQPMRVSSRACPMSDVRDSEWWAFGDLNTGPRAYQARALTN